MKTKTCVECHYMLHKDTFEVCTHSMTETSMFGVACKHFEPPTNGDKIRQVSNRELAEISIYEDKMSGGEIIYRSTLIADKFFLTKNCAVSVVEALLNAPAESEKL